MFYIVSTPIGNLQDITLRAVEILKQVDYIACEDTRHTHKLLQAHGISGKLIAYHDHSGEKERHKIVSLLQQGQDVALVSDAGTPMISDPGYKLINAVHKAKIEVTALPGACAVINALVLSGLPSNQFYFGGFFPANETALQTMLNNIKHLPASLVFYDRASKIISHLQSVLDIMGDRNVCLAREMTKQFEQTIHSTISELMEKFIQTPPKGELVLIIAGSQGDFASWDEVDAFLQIALKTQSVKDAVQEAVDLFPFRKKEIYQRALEMSS